jgi:NADPH:quinone reductase-like Zn-dependent oxidoreductase
VKVGSVVDESRVDKRVLVRTMLTSCIEGRKPFECWAFSSECDGAFAQYIKAPSKER